MPIKHQNRRQPRRRGSVIVTTAFFMVVFVGFIALVVDLGYVVNSKAELQRTADAAAMAACWDYAQNLSEDVVHADAAISGAAALTQASANNLVCGATPTMPASDVQWGYLADFSDRTSPLETSNPNVFNAVQVSVRRTSGLNGVIPFFFARAFGMQGIESSSSATAAIVRTTAGFQLPSDGSNLDILPFALDEESWLDLLAGETTDQWSWNKETKTMGHGSDGIFEVNLYPQGTGSPGNRGTIDIGSSNNNTNDICRQIMNGISSSDLGFHGGKLQFDANGELELNGDTGISAGVKDELASIKGKPRMIPIFRSVRGPGNNAQYTIVAWAGVRILDVKLTGSKRAKRVTIQPAAIVTKGAIPGEATDSSYYIYSPVVLVR